MPRKNMQPVGEKPLVQYTMEAALGATRLARCVVSSDDAAVLELTRALGTLVPLRRPAALAGDDAATVDVVRHVLDEERDTTGAVPEVIVLLQPTSPFRTAADVDAAIAAFEQSGRESLISVCPVSQHPAECVRRTEDGNLDLLAVPRVAQGAGRQGYAPYYFIDGAIYICTTEKFSRDNAMFDCTSAMFLLPKSHSLDIDDWFGLQVARALAYYAGHQDSSVFTY